MDRQTTDTKLFADIFIITSQLKHWKHYKAHQITYDVTIKKFVKLLDVRSLLCKIKVLNSRIWELEKRLLTKDNQTDKLTQQNYASDCSKAETWKVKVVLSK